MFKNITGKTVFVTGATGLMGTAVCGELLRQKCRVIALVRDLGKGRCLLPSEVRFVQGDVLVKPDVADDIDYVIHAACPTTSSFFVEHPEETRKIIVEGTRNMLDLAHDKGARLVYVSSMEVFGQCEKVDVGEDDLGYLDPLLPRNSYPLGKRDAEGLCKVYADKNVDAVIARPVQTFGAGVPPTDNRVFMQFARAKMNGSDIVLKTTGEKAHCYCEIGDCVRGLLTVMESGIRGEVYNISNEDTFCTIREMAEMLVGKNRVRVDLDPGIYPPCTRMRVLSGKIRSLGWRPTCGLQEMYDRLINYLEEVE